MYIRLIVGIIIMSAIVAASSFALEGNYKEAFFWVSTAQINFAGLLLST